MEKDLFIKRMNTILDFEKEQKAISSLIDKITDGYPVVTFGGDLILELLSSINEAMNIRDNDLLSWWLWENVDKIIYYTEKDNKQEIKVETLEELYDYILNWEG